ncbi:MAG TPA: helix-turn-helix transcriptional regulator [Thermoanaerobaculia bacterium]|nr:helix-turn-helix transcriptional regulator [Thermoanaerobaculia bacterium]
MTDRSSPLEPVALKPADFHILLVLSEGNLHGYGLMKQVEEQSQGRVRLEVGSLYRLIDRLRSQGLIERAGEEDGDSRRRDYRITGRGRATLELEVERLREVAALLREKRLFGPGEGSR